MKGKVLGLVLVSVLAVFLMSAISCSKKTPSAPVGEATVGAVVPTQTITMTSTTGVVIPSATKTATTTSTITIASPTATTTSTITTVYVPATAPWTFDTTNEGFAVDTVTDLAISSAVRNTSPAGIKNGAGSLALTADFSSGTMAKGYVSIDLLPAPLDLTGKVISLWINVPAGLVGYGMQMVAKTGPAKSYNGTWKNIDTAGWVKFTWEPNLANVTDIGIQIMRNGFATAYVGTIYTDEWTITNVVVAPAAVYNFDTSKQGWTNDTVTDVAITGLAWDNVAGDAKAGAGSIQLTADFSTSLTSQGLISVDLTAAPIDLTGKTLDIWINLPTSMVGYGAQIGYKIGSGGWNFTWQNLSTAGWTKLSCSPTGAAANVTMIGLQVLRISAPTPYTGTFNLDEITYY